MNDWCGSLHKPLQWLHLLRCPSLRTHNIASMTLGDWHWRGIWTPCATASFTDTWMSLRYIQVSSDPLCVWLPFNPVQCLESFRTYFTSSFVWWRLLCVLLRKAWFRLPNDSDLSGEMLHSTADGYKTNWTALWKNKFIDKGVGGKIYSNSNFWLYWPREEMLACFVPGSISPSYSLLVSLSIFPQTGCRSRYICDDNGNQSHFFGAL